MTLTCRQAWSVTPGTRSSRSPVSVSDDHFGEPLHLAAEPGDRERVEQLRPRADRPAACPVWILFMHR